jgi:hypothetical protein
MVTERLEKIHNHCWSDKTKMDEMGRRFSTHQETMQISVGKSKEKARRPKFHVFL